MEIKTVKQMEASGVYNIGDFLKVGDAVEEAFVEEAINCLPPRTMNHNLVQMGEPYSHRPDPDDTEKECRKQVWKPTYLTYARLNDGLWHYMGNCFAEQTKNIV